MVGSSEGPLLGYSFLSWWEDGERALCGVSLIRTQIPFMRALSS